MKEAAIRVDSVKKSFGKNAVLEGVSFTVEPGEVFALLGRNGAGKTTLIRTLLGLLTPDSGAVRVLGLDPRQEALPVRKRVGFLAEDQTMYGWMTVEEILGFVAPFYDTWDHDLAGRYVAEFELSPRTKIRHLSKGQNVRLGLILALAHRPELIVLDDPALGLDPILRKEFNRDIVTHLQGEGVAVLYSSHLLYEVEPVADSVAILDGGRIVVRSGTEELRDRVKRFVVSSEVWEGDTDFGAVLDVSRHKDEVAVTVVEAGNVLERLRAAQTPHRLVDLNLDEIFEAYVIGKQEVRSGERRPPGQGVVGQVA